MAYNNRGWSYNELGQYQNALIDLDKSIQLDTDDANPYINRGYSYASLGQDAEAKADKAKACSLDKQYC